MPLFTVFRQLPRESCYTETGYLFSIELQSLTRAVKLTETASAPQQKKKTFWLCDLRHLVL